MHYQGQTRKVRSLFVSDVHLGCRYAHAEAFLAFLETQTPECLYLVGDFIDGWRLRKSWHWQPVYTQILRRLFELAERGTLLRYAPGNHDNFLRHFLLDFGLVEIQNEFIHQAIDGRRFLVLHGDQFDNVEQRAQWLSWIGSSGYDMLTWSNGLVNRCRRACGYRPWQFSSYAKKIVKRAVTFVSNFEAQLKQHAAANQCQGVICGHVHTPVRSLTGPIAYFNTGDWVENGSALAEYSDGSWELIHPPLTAEETLSLPQRAPHFQSALPAEAVSGERGVAEEAESLASIGS